MSEVHFFARKLLQFLFALLSLQTSAVDVFQEQNAALRKIVEESVQAVIRNAWVVQTEDVQVQVEMPSESEAEACLAGARRSIQQKATTVGVTPIRVETLTLWREIVGDVGDQGIFLRGLEGHTLNGACRARDGLHPLSVSVIVAVHVTRVRTADDQALHLLAQQRVHAAEAERERGELTAALAESFSRDVLTGLANGRETCLNR